MSGPRRRPASAKAATAGYSGTPLARKLGIAEGTQVLLKGAPGQYRAWLEPLPPNVRFVARLSAATDLVHLFATRRTDLQRELLALRPRIRPSGAVWVSWPKQSCGMTTDITEGTIREIALPLGFVDIKVCAVSEAWSGLKLVIRKALR